MSLWIKVCGITTPAAARAAVEEGADAVGFVLHAGSPAHVEPSAAAAIAAELPSRVERIAVFVNAGAPDVIAGCREAGLALAQIHGDVDPALRGVPDPDWYPAIPLGREVTAGPILEQVAAMGRSRFLLETSGAELPGQTAGHADWNLAGKVSMGLVLRGGAARLILSGGLTAASVGLAVRTVRPWGVDLSLAAMGSGSQADTVRIRAAVRAARSLA
jgi:phosphoribosylanthranilate isomerase